MRPQHAHQSLKVRAVLVVEQDQELRVLGGYGLPRRGRPTLVHAFEHVATAGRFDHGVRDSVAAGSKRFVFAGVIEKHARPCTRRHRQRGQALLPPRHERFSFYRLAEDATKLQHVAE